MASRCGTWESVEVNVGESRTYAANEKRPPRQPSANPNLRRSQRSAEPPDALCRWHALEVGRCAVTRRRPVDLPPHEPVLDCGQPACRARSDAYRRELAGERVPRRRARSAARK
jgi:hypothetical protein